MIISEKYGPQFDPTDGTVGKTQLVKRWAVANSEGFMFGASQGRYTHATEQEALKELSNIKANNLTIGDSLRVAQFWCWPIHFDPVAVVENRINNGSL